MAQRCAVAFSPVSVLPLAERSLEVDDGFQSSSPLPTWIQEAGASLRGRGAFVAKVKGPLPGKHLEPKLSITSLGGGTPWLFSRLIHPSMFLEHLFSHQGDYNVGS